MRNGKILTLLKSRDSQSESFLKLLDAEQDEAQESLKKRLSTWSLDRLQEEGYCLTGLIAYWLQENQFGRPVALFGLGPGLALPDHKFEYVAFRCSWINFMIDAGKELK